MRLGGRAMRRPYIHNLQLAQKYCRRRFDTIPSAVTAVVMSVGIVYATPAHDRAYGTDYLPALDTHTVRQLMPC